MAHVFFFLGQDRIYLRGPFEPTSSLLVLRNAQSLLAEMVLQYLPPGTPATVLSQQQANELRLAARGHSSRVGLLTLGFSNRLQPTKGNVPASMSDQFDRPQALPPGFLDDTSEADFELLTQELHPAQDQRRCWRPPSGTRQARFHFCLEEHVDLKALCAALLRIVPQRQSCHDCSRYFTSASEEFREECGVGQHGPLLAGALPHPPRSVCTTTTPWPSSAHCG